LPSRRRPHLGAAGEVGTLGLPQRIADPHATPPTLDGVRYHQHLADQLRPALVEIGLFADGNRGVGPDQVDGEIEQKGGKPCAQQPSAGQLPVGEANETRKA